MKTLTLLRHAKSSWQHHLPDHQRPLNPRGRKDAPEMGLRLKERRVRPDRIVCSTAVRTRETVEQLLPALELPSDVVFFDKRIYEASVGDLLVVISGTSDTVDHLMLIGHNPGLERLVDRWLPDGIGHLPTTGVVSLSFEIDHWKDIATATGDLLLYDFPKNQD